MLINYVDSLKVWGLRPPTPPLTTSGDLRRLKYEFSRWENLQLALFNSDTYRDIRPFSKQLLKWVGNKQRFAHEIISYFPLKINRYFEPFLGSGAVLGTFGHQQSIASDIFKPLMEIWTALHDNPEELKKWYKDRCGCNRWPGRSDQS